MMTIPTLIALARAAGGSNFDHFTVAFAAAQGLWLLRWLEIALLSHDEESRRFSSLRLVDCVSRRHDSA